MMDIVWRPPRNEPVAKRQALDWSLPETFKYYGNWGFTIYRTYYGAESDKHWDILLDALKRQTQLALAYLEDEDEYRYDVERRSVRQGRGLYKTREEYMDDLKRLRKLFHLNPREDPSLLAGLDVRQLREVCLSEQPEAKKTMAEGLFRYVLVADETVLKDIAKGEFVIKAVAYDWEENSEEWGWMRIPTGYLLELWHALMFSRFHPHRVLRFDGPEEDLGEYIWPGDFAINPTGTCSEVRPSSTHYSAQRPLFKVERR
ncbi:hypothetical protein ACJ41O_009428 [Fusarium nematophilum]